MSDEASPTDFEEPTSGEPVWTRPNLSWGNAGRILLVVAVVAYLVLNRSFSRGWGSSFGFFILLLGAWVLRDMVRLVIQKPKRQRPNLNADPGDAAAGEVEDEAEDSRAA